MALAVGYAVSNALALIGAGVATQAIGAQLAVLAFNVAVAGPVTIGQPRLCLMMLAKRPAGRR